MKIFDMLIELLSDIFIPFVEEKLDVSELRNEKLVETVKTVRISEISDESVAVNLDLSSQKLKKKRKETKRISIIDANMQLEKEIWNS